MQCEKPSATHYDTAEHLCSALQSTYCTGVLVSSSAACCCGCKALSPCLATRSADDYHNNMQVNSSQSTATRWCVNRFFEPRSPRCGLAQ